MHRVRSTLTAFSAAAAVAVAGCGDGPEPTALQHDAGSPPVSAASTPSFCPSGLHKRSPEQVLEDLRAALAAGDMDAAICNYAVDATVLADGGVDVGHDQIRPSLEFFNGLFGGTQPVVVQQVIVEVPMPHTHMARVLWTIDTSCVSIPDGVNTYAIRQGLIHGQTAHGFPVFHC